RTVLLLPERFGVKRAGRARDAGENRQGEKGRKDRLHDHLLSVCVLAVVTTASPTPYLARLARTERWRHAHVTNVDHFGIEPDSTSSRFRAVGSRTSGVASQERARNADTRSFGAVYFLAWLAKTNDGWLRLEHGVAGRRSPASCASSERRATCARSQSVSRQLSLRLQPPWPGCWRWIPIIRGPAWLFVLLAPLLTFRWWRIRRTFPQEATA